jgi:acetolactate synthase-1/2/3 large subunit
VKGTTVEILVKYLEQENVKFLFGVPGGHLLPLYDAIYRTSTIKPVLTKNEGGGAFMAYGYAYISGNIGVCCSTVGPGATNMVTGVACAYADSIPLLVLTAQVGTKTFGRSAHQEGTGYGRFANHTALYEKITKMSVMVADKDAFPRTLRTALRIAQSGRPGPVHLDLPTNIQLGEIADDIQQPQSYRPAPMDNGVDNKKIIEIADLLYNARKPVILVGHGAAKCAKNQTLIQLIERLQMPVATTPKAKGIVPEDHDLSLGCFSLRGSKAANAYLRSDIDVLLVAGSDLGEHTTLGWDSKLVPEKALIQIDIDPSEIGKNYPIAIGLVADAYTAIEALERHVSTMPPKEKIDLKSFKESKQYFKEKESFKDIVPLKPQRLMAGLRKHLPKSAIQFVDMGNTFSWSCRYFQTYPEGKAVFPSGMACMGSSVAASIGGKLASPENIVVCFCGDGDFFMTGLEVLTAVDYDIPVIWVILKNNRLGGIYDHQTLSYKGRHTAVAFRDTDFVAIAKAFGAEGYRIERPEEIADTINKAVNCRKPTIIEAVIDADEKFPVTIRSKAIRDSLGLPKAIDSISAESIKAFLKMIRNKEV